MATTKYDGVFSAGLFSLQLQLKNLLEGTGGDHALLLLDTLAKMSASEQKVALDVFTRVLERVAAGEQRLFTDGDLALKEFEDNLYNDIVSAMDEASKPPSLQTAKASTSGKFSVLDGGRSHEKVALKVVTSRPVAIDFKSAAKNRKTRTTNHVN